VILLTAPGPGLVVIAVALAVFAIEYEWARRRLAAIRERARSAAFQAAASRAAAFCAFLFVIGTIGLGAVLIVTNVLPLSGAGTGAGAAVAGVTVLVTVAYSMRQLRRAERPARTNVPSRRKRLRSRAGPRRATAGRATDEPAIARLGQRGTSRVRGQASCTQTLRRRKTAAQGVQSTASARAAATEAKGPSYTRPRIPGC
jgi:Putative transmembrane protein (PGPGW)